MPRNAVTRIPAAPADVAQHHFESEFTFETDCADVHEAMASANPGFVLLDVRAPSHFAAGHVPGAVNLPHGKIIRSKLSDYPDDTLFVVYCDGPHCNGASRGAARLAALGRPVKKMAGGIHGWELDGFCLAKGW